MRLLPILLLIALAGNAVAQRHKLTINAETPEGQLLQQIGQENDPAKKIALMDDFLSKYPKHEGVSWVLDTAVAANLKASEFDKTLKMGEMLLAIDADDVTTAHNCLKAAEGKKDAALIQKWAGITSKAARKAAAAPQPKEEDAVENWKASVDYAKQVDTYTEYSLYATALASTDPNAKIQLYEALEAQNPSSQYIGQLRPQYFLALRQTNSAKALAFAEKTLETDQNNEDMLLVVADNYFNKKSNPAKVIALSTKLTEVMSAKQKPEGVSDEDWNKRKNLLTGLGFWMAGLAYADQNKFKETDELLRKALPLVEGNDPLKAQALFYLGLANYKMGDPRKDKRLMMESLKFNQQCAAMKSPFQGQAAKNATVIKQQYGLK